MLVGTHKLQFGGSGGDGYCYTHGSFDCCDHLTPEEQEAVNNPEDLPPVDDSLPLSAGDESISLQRGVSMRHEVHGA